MKTSNTAATPATQRPLESKNASKAPPKAQAVASSIKWAPPLLTPSPLTSQKKALHLSPKSSLDIYLVNSLARFLLIGDKDMTTDTLDRISGMRGKSLAADLQSLYQKENSISEEDFKKLAKKYGFDPKAFKIPSHIDQNRIDTLIKNTSKLIEVKNFVYAFSEALKIPDRVQKHLLLERLESEVSNLLTDWEFYVSKQTDFLATAKYVDFKARNNDLLKQIRIELEKS